MNHALAKRERSVSLKQLAESEEPPLKTPTNEHNANLISQTVAPVLRSCPGESK